jgi:hypothetical protein
MKLFADFSMPFNDNWKCLMFTNYSSVNSNDNNDEESADSIAY